MAKVIFIQNLWSEHLGVMILFAVLKRSGHSCSIIFNIDKSAYNQLIKLSPDIVAFYTVTGFHRWSLIVASEVKRIFGNKVITVMGGPHATFFPEVIENQNIDIDLPPKKWTQRRVGGSINTGS